MATIAFQTRSEAKKTVTIYFYLSMGRKKFIRMKTGFHIRPSDWSKYKGMPKQNNANNKALAASLNKLKLFIEKSINDAETAGETIDREFLKRQVAQCFNRNDSSDEEFVQYQIRHIIEHAPTRLVKQTGKVGLAENTIKNYKSFLAKWIAFEDHQKREIRFRDLSYELGESFKLWQLNMKNYSVNSVGKDMSRLAQIAKEVGLKGVPVHPQASMIKGFSQTDDDRYIVTFSHEELDRIGALVFTKEKMRLAQKWFLLGCELGQRGGDLMRINPKNIRLIRGNKVIEITQKKTKKTVVIPLVKRAQIILEEGFPEPMFEQEFNRLIKEVAKQAGFDELTPGYKATVTKKSAERRNQFGKYPKWELVTSHCCRRSFATNYYKKIPTPILMEVTGHAKESTFLKYINKQRDKDDNALQFLSYLKH